MIFICFCRQLEAEFAGSRKALCEASIVNIHDFAYFQVHFVVNVVVDCGAVTASEAWEKYAFLTITSLHCI